VFAHHRAVMDRLCEFLAKDRQDELQNFIRIDGSVPSKERFDLVDRFQRSSTCRVAVLAITAAGVAITLTAASTVFFAELFWTPGSMLQAEDRAHRIGQTSTVRVFYFLARGSVDDVIWPLVQKKMKTLGEVVEGVKNHDMALSYFGADSDVGESSLTATIEGRWR
jgi:SWI/SNF-related matrix-associated actin-dependent regulator of chromatin subfamily A-like protein 1